MQLLSELHFRSQHNQHQSKLKAIISFCSFASLQATLQNHALTIKREWISETTLDYSYQRDSRGWWLSRFSTRLTFPCAAERLLFLKQCTRTNKDVQFPRNSMTNNLLKYFQSCFSSIAVAFPLSWNTEVLCQSLRAI